MTPVVFLVAVVGITVGAALGQAGVRWGEKRRLRGLAASWGMHYVPGDRFRLADRVAERLGELGVPGAADVVVSDVMYAVEGEGGQRYIVTVEYTVGVTRSKRRVRRVCAMREVRRGGRGEIEDLRVVGGYEGGRGGEGGIGG